LKWSETGDLDIIECADGAKTIVKLRSAKGNHAYLRSLVELDQALGLKGNARKYMQRQGEMWQLGLLNMGRERIQRRCRLNGLGIG
jgi:Holliday junction resolvase-like predicted endonuclease